MGSPAKYEDAILQSTLDEILGIKGVVLTDKYRTEITRYLDTDPEENKEETAAWLKIKKSAARRNIMEIYWRPRTATDVVNFYPSGDSQQGFLGWGEQLEAVIAEDAQELERLGKTPNEVGMKLKEILDAAFEKMKGRELESVSRTPIDIGNHIIEAQGHMGYQNCPFKTCEFHNAPCQYSSIDFKVTNKKTGEYVKGPGLIWHLITEHEFFEGKKNEGKRSLRTEPAQMVKVLFE